MQQRKVDSLIGALVLIISAVVLITGCPQPNSNNYTSYDGTVISFSVSGNILKINNRRFLRLTDPNTLEKVKKVPIV